MTRINTHSKSFVNKHRGVWVSLFLIISTLSIYWQIQNYDFINLDDNIYVTENPHVLAGLTKEGLFWSFRFTHEDDTHWHPLTWLSHMLDCQLYGLRPGLHHLTSLILHVANALLLFLVLRRMTGALWKSAFVAALFALHPINVDSIAWVAERKNVLSTVFWMLTILTYSHYCERPGLYRYLLVFLIFSLGLLVKPMLVTLPFVLLLLDYWPLERIGSGQQDSDNNKQKNKSKKYRLQGSIAFRLVLEKVPFLVLSMISIYLSSTTVQGIRISTESVPMKLRIANGLVSYVSYIGKMIWPQNLAVIYPYPTTMLPMWQTAGAFLLLICISILVIWLYRGKPFLVVGWLWYLGTLVPVLGLVQVGLWPAMADRWAYVPLIGLFIIIAWGVSDFATQLPHRKVVLAITAAIILFAFMVITFLQVRYWKNSITLFEHTLKVTSDNFRPHINLGNALQRQGRLDEAIKHYSEALRLKPDLEEAHNNLGSALEKRGRIDEAIKHYLEALRLKPDLEAAHNNLGNALEKQGRIDEAIKHYLEALRLKPDYVEAHTNLGNTLQKQGRLDEAIGYYLEALRINPVYEKAHNNLGVTLFHKGNMEEAINHFQEALRIRPDYVDAKNNLNKVLMIQRQRQ